MMILLTSCSSTLDSQLCYVNGNLDYLEKRNLLHELSCPGDVMLPTASNVYKIPNVSCDSPLNVGKNLNICPPNATY